MIIIGRILTDQNIRYNAIKVEIIGFDRHYGIISIEICRYCRCGDQTDDAGPMECLYDSRQMRIQMLGFQGRADKPPLEQKALKYEKPCL